jgi:PAS domain-containing protein
MASTFNRMASEVEKSSTELRTEVFERKQAQDELYKVASIVESADDAIISTELAGKILSWNAGAERMFGYCAEEVFGNMSRCCFHRIAPMRNRGSLRESSAVSASSTPRRCASAKTASHTHLSDRLCRQERRR